MMYGGRYEWGFIYDCCGVYVFVFRIYGGMMMRIRSSMYGYVWGIR